MTKKTAIKLVLPLILVVSGVFFAISAKTEPETVEVAVSKPIKRTSVAENLDNSTHNSCDGTEETCGVPDLAEAQEPREPEDIDTYLHRMGITLKVQTKETSTAFPRSSEDCKKLVYEALKSMPATHTNALNTLILDFPGQGSRGLGGGSTLIIRCDKMSDPEFISVFVHEMGHIVDGNFLIGSTSSGDSAYNDLGRFVPNNDLSTEFYNLSWENNIDWKPGTLLYSFCSNYGSTDPYEDFAECYNYYLLHGAEFRKSAEKNEILANKYQFMRDKIFDGKEYSFDLAASVNSSTNKMPEDTTQLSYNYDSFVASK